jgi:hypothetical protein
MTAPTLQRLTLDKYLALLNSGLGHAYIGHYKKNPSCYLAELCDKYGSDKGELKEGGHPYPWPSHTYSDFYSRLFGHCRNYIKKVFECGLGTNNPNLLSSMGVNGKPGASLRVWRDYFPNAQIVGADIDRDILFKEERIETFFVDQTDPKSIEDLWRNSGLDCCDFMIDDGLHTYSAGICLFENSIERLSPSGIYIIEDVSTQNLMMFKQYFSNKPYQVDFVNLLRPTGVLSDNNLVVVRNY